MINKETVLHFQEFNAQDKSNNPYNNCMVTIYDIKEYRANKERYNTPIERLKRFAEYLTKQISTLQELLNIIVGICGNELEPPPYEVDENTIKAMNTNVTYLFRLKRRPAM